MIAAAVVARAELDPVSLAVWTHPLLGRLAWWIRTNATTAHETTVIRAVLLLHLEADHGPA